MRISVSKCQMDTAGMVTYRDAKACHATLCPTTSLDGFFYCLMLHYDNGKSILSPSSPSQNFEGAAFLNDLFSLYVEGGLSFLLAIDFYRI